MERDMRVRGGQSGAGSHQVPRAGRGHVRGPQLHWASHVPPKVPSHWVPQRHPD